MRIYTTLTAWTLVCLGAMTPKLGQAATIHAATASLTDVTAAVAGAAEGDTVIVPAGTAKWTSGLTITKGITLQGASTVSNTGSPPTAYAVTDSTVLLDEIPRTTSDVTTFLINATLTPNQTFRMTGFTFRSGSVTTRAANALVRINGTCPGATGVGGGGLGFRVDHCHFDQLYGQHFVPGGWLYGVIDHCVFDARAGSSEILIVHHTNWGGSGNLSGDGSWADPPYFGSEKFVFVEDCTFNNIGSSNRVNGSVDSWDGGRTVIRHTTFNNCAPGVHGTETSGRLRSSRALEWYNNTINFSSISSVLGEIRGGTGVIHDNTYAGGVTNGIALRAERELFPFYNFGGASGNNPWDLNDTEGDGTNVSGHASHLYASGTHNGSNASNTLVDSTAHWTPDEWVGFEITNLDLPANAAQGITYYNSRIISNTANSITFDQGGAVLGNGTSPTFVFNAGDRYEVRKVLAALDQPGRGQGDLLSGASPIITNTTTGTIAWPHQALEPIYSWNNTLNGSPNYVMFVTMYPTIQLSRDYYENTALAGYKSYIYPHPLVSGIPAPPTGLKVLP